VIQLKEVVLDDLKLNVPFQFEVPRGARAIAVTMKVIGQVVIANSENQAQQTAAPAITFEYDPANVDDMVNQRFVCIGFDYPIQEEARFVAKVIATPLHFYLYELTGGDNVVAGSRDGVRSSVPSESGDPVRDR